MSESATLIIEFQDEAGGGCGDRVLEVVDSEYAVDKKITFKAWALNYNKLKSLFLTYGCGRRIGVGSMISLPNSFHTEEVSFDGVKTQQLKYPLYYVYTAVALTDIMGVSDAGVGLCIATKGSAVAGLKKIGGSCIGLNNSAYFLSGTIKVKYARAKTYRSWFYTPRRSGDYWFYFSDNGKIVHSLKITVPEEEEGILTNKGDRIICIKDYVSLGVVEGFSVTVDGTYKGLTDEDGCVELKNIELGEHTISLSKTGYLNNESDDLDNDTFTVS